MTEFERSFERRFSSNASLGKIDVAYRKWLLKGGEENPQGIPSEEERIAADDWYKRCVALIEEAEDLAKAGISRNGFEFDDLKRRAMSLADECFTGSDRGIVFAYVAQAYDKARQSAEESETRETVENGFHIPGWIPKSSRRFVKSRNWRHSVMDMRKDLVLYALNLCEITGTLSYVSRLRQMEDCLLN